MNVLIVEDDLSTCDLLARFFGGRGVSVTFAHTLADGRRLLEGGPCAMLLDLGLPDGSGLALLDAAHRAARPVPVAVVTGLGGAEVADAATLRPSALFTKPADMSELLAWVRHVCPAA